jgi:hypothetical protein
MTQYAPFFRIIVIVVVIGAAITLLIRVPKLIFQQNTQSGAKKCAKDPRYHYKDPSNHPYDC